MLWNLFDRRGRLLLLALVGVMLAAALIEALAVAAVLPFLSGLSDPATFRVPFQTGGDVSAQQETVLVLAVVFSLAVVLAIGLKAVADYAAVAFSSTQTARWSRNLLLGHLNRDYDWFLGQNSGNLGYGLLGRVQEVVNGSLLPALRLMVAASAALFICIVLLHKLPPSMFLIVFGLLLVYSAVFILLRRRLVANGKEKESVGALRFRLTSEVLGGIKEIKLHGLEAGYDDRVRGPFERYAFLQAQKHLYSILPRYVLEALGFVTVCIFVLVVGADAKGLQGVVPLLGLFGFAAFRLLPAVQQIYFNAVSLPIGLTALETLHHDLTTSDCSLPSVARPLGLHQAMEIRDARYVYPGSDRAAINGIDVRLEAGSMVALVGRSGSGKSTIADFTLGLLTPASGSIRVDGVLLDEQTRRSWQAGCSYVAQQVYLLDDTIAANIAFGLPAPLRDMGKVVQAAKAAALHDFIVGGLPAGYDTEVGERGVRLSGGQRQRIGIARALYRDSSYIVLDEATNALDSHTESEVLAALEAIRGSRTILVIAHRLSTIAECDRVLLIDEGRIIADGRYQDLMRSHTQFREFAQLGSVDPTQQDVA